MTDQTAPERIWATFEAHPNPKDKVPYVFASAARTKGVEYVPADTITAQQAVIDELVSALEPFSKEAEWWFCKNYSASDVPVEGFEDYQSVMTCGDLFNARAALAKAKETT